MNQAWRMGRESRGLRLGAEGTQGEVQGSPLIQPHPSTWGLI